MCAPSVKMFNEARQGNIAANAARGLKGYEIWIPSADIGVSRPARTIHPSWQKVRKHLDAMPKETRRQARVYDLSLRARVL